MTKNMKNTLTRLLAGHFIVKPFGMVKTGAVCISEDAAKGNGKGHLVRADTFTALVGRKMIDCCTAKVKGSAYTLTGHGIKKAKNALTLGWLK